MNDISFEAMKFGSENDLKIALTELKWIKSIHGKLTQDDFKTVAEKYRFPTDFLEKAVSGLSYPDDYQISKSKWYTVLYSWTLNKRELSLRLYELQIDYHKALHRSTIFLGILGVVLLQLGSTLDSFLKLDTLQLLSIIVVPFALFFISMLIELRNIVSDKRNNVEEFTAHLKEKGFEEIVTTNERFIKQNYRFVVFAGDVLLQKLRLGPSMAFFYAGFTEEKVQKRLGRVSRLLIKLHIISPLALRKRKFRYSTERMRTLRTEKESGNLRADCLVRV